MARFSYAERDNYAGGVNTFFTLKDDKDTARVRFLLNDLNDMKGVTCHEVEVGGKRIDVECLRNYEDPVENCPLCNAGYRPSAKLFIPLYNEDAKASQIWVRGRKFFDRLSSLCSRFNPLVATSFEIERNGKAGDTNTTYEIYSGKTDGARVTDYPEMNAEGTAFEARSFDDLANFVATGKFGDRQSSNTQHQQSERQVPVRRRPTNYNAEDSF